MSSTTDGVDNQSTTLTVPQGVKQGGLDISPYYAENRREFCMNNLSLLKKVSRYFEIAQKAAVSGSLTGRDGHGLI